MSIMDDWSLHVVGVEGGNNRDIRHKSKDYINDPQ